MREEGALDLVPVQELPEIVARSRAVEAERQDLDGPPSRAASP
jgi:hypothetical protein